MNLIDYKKYKITHQPGVYLYYDQKQVIYVGKAKDLAKRTRQYFQAKAHDPKTSALVKEIFKIETIVTASELDALFLESELIKRYQPKYNILLRDDKSTTYLKISNQKLPIISYTRNPIDDGADYFGPFYNISPVKQAMRYLRWIFPYLTKQSVDKNNSKLNRQIGLEPSLTSQTEIDKYLTDIKQIKMYLKGKRKQIIKDLERQMKQLADKQQFEQAAKVLKQINQLNSLQHKVRIDQITNDQDFSLNQLSLLFNLSVPANRIEGYDVSHMSGTNVVSSMVVFTNGLSDRANYRKFKIKIDQNDDFYNMRETLARRANKNWTKPDLILIDGGKGQLESAIAALKNTDLTRVPIFGLAKKQELIIIDKNWSNIDLNQQLLDQKQGSFVNQHDFIIVDLDNSDPIIKLIQRIRNEAHRFAIGYHSRLKRRGQTISQLDTIKGIGPKTKQKLIKKYKTISNIKQTPEHEIAKLIGPAKAKQIKQTLKSGQN